MSTAETTHVDLDTEAINRRHRRRRRRHSVLESSDLGTEGSLCLSDSDDQSWHSTFGSTTGGSYDDEARFSGDGGVSLSDCESDADLERGVLDLKACLDTRIVKDCRICHLSLVHSSEEEEKEEEEEEEQEIRVSSSAAASAIELGCSCKGDLAAAHKQCAEKWFKIKGNTTCEICGTTALNVVCEHTNETDATAEADAEAATVILTENRSFCHDRRIMKFLLACLVFAFVISWLFHYNVFS